MLWGRDVSWSITTTRYHLIQLVCGGFGSVGNIKHSSDVSQVSTTLWAVLCTCLLMRSCGLLTETVTRKKYSTCRAMLEYFTLRLLVFRVFFISWTTATSHWTNMRLHRWFVSTSIEWTPENWEQPFLSGHRAACCGHTTFPKRSNVQSLVRAP